MTFDDSWVIGSSKQTGIVGLDSEVTYNEDVDFTGLYEDDCSCADDSEEVDFLGLVSTYTKCCHFGSKAP